MPVIDLDEVVLNSKAQLQEFVKMYSAFEIKEGEGSVKSKKESFKFTPEQKKVFKQKLIIFIDEYKYSKTPKYIICLNSCQV